VKYAAVLVFVVWATANLVDNVRVMRETYVHPHPDPHRELTDFLLNQRIRYAYADYWDAYIVDFLSRERVIVASLGPVRIPEYQRKVDENAAAAAHIVRMPCEGQLRIAVWCIQMPVNRPGGGAR
jgi:hypothetical protein